MKNKTLYSGLIVFLIFTFAFLPFTAATPYILSQGGAYYSYLQAGNSNGSGAQMSITGNGMYLKTFTVYVANSSATMSGSLRACLYSAYQGNTSVEWSTSTIDMAIIGNNDNTYPNAFGDFSAVSFAFSGDTLLEDSTTYGIAVMAYSGVSGTWYLACDQSGSKAIRANYAGAWTYDSGGLMYNVIVEDTVNPTATPTPTPTTPAITPSPTPYGGFTFDFNAFIMSGTALAILFLGIIFVILGILLMMKVNGAWMPATILIVIGFFACILSQPNLMGLVGFALAAICATVFGYTGTGKKNK